VAHPDDRGLTGLRSAASRHRLFHHEDDLINHRLTWLIGSESLLFTGYAVLVSGVASGSVAQTVRWLPLLGIAVAGTIWVGILGAVAASLILKRRYGQHTLGIHWLTTAMGWAPGTLLPLIFMTTWTVLLL
jgi:hypothetical protein